MATAYVRGDAVSPFGAVCDLLFELSRPSPDLAKIARYEASLSRLAPPTGQRLITHTQGETGITYVVVVERGKDIRVHEATAAHRLPAAFPEHADDLAYSCVIVDGEVE